MTAVSIVGCGFVADLYLRSFRVHPGVILRGVYDRDPDRARAFAAFWNVPCFDSLAALLADHPRDGVVLNLTNPGEHTAVTRACLLAGAHVFCEKPMTLDMAEATDLMALARSSGLQLASAPSSVLGETAQTLGHALRGGAMGTPRLIYAELDDGFVSQAPVADWVSPSGAPWPFADEFRVGCTLEHAGYYLSWMIAHFGPVARVVTASAEILPDKLGVSGGAPDFSVATLFFRGGLVARLTCSIVAPHDHRLRVITDAGVLQVNKAWDNGAPVRFRRRFVLRRRLLEHPIGRRVRLAARATHPKVKRLGAAAMNFALGPVEMLDAIAAGRDSRLAGDYALHLNEVTLAVQSRAAGQVQEMQTTCAPAMEPMPWAR
ncbi:MAG: Gfo/Idh/MocA family oxidoreductase [Rhodobacteraceae bacterium]|nr:Gfo/Idh/MocA family oxidoreductase [Paracoccaceae bacterium]